MMIRYFAAINDSVSSTIALAHLVALRRMAAVDLAAGRASSIAPIRLVSPGYDVNSAGAVRWREHTDLLSTPLEQEYVNVVCCEPQRWNALVTPPLIQSRAGAPQYPSGCLRNVLILTEQPRDALIHVVDRYDVVINKVTCATIALLPCDGLTYDTDPGQKCSSCGREGQRCEASSVRGARQAAINTIALRVNLKKLREAVTI